jgi:formate C-acetyltransferase
MNHRTARLRQQSLDALPRISAERAVLLTEFYQANAGLFSVPVMRAKSFLHLCQHKTIYLGTGELIVGERGPVPKLVPTFPELTCHSVEDLKILNSRPKTWYRVDDETIRLYEEKVIPYWRGRSLRDQIFAALPEDWRAAYDAGMFTEFMEQRAPGHTVLDDKIYSKGMQDFKCDIATAVAKLDFLNDPLAFDKRETLRSFDIACDAVIVFAERHAALARELAAKETDPQRRVELNRIAEVCSRVPANAPENFHEALQYYWFCHLAVITELNGWDSFNPGHLDQHLLPFYEKGLADGSLTRETARELLECFFIKFNNHPAPPKVGVTAAESGTYTDFANINIGGLLRDGSDGSNEISHLLLEIVEDMHLLQPSTNIQLSRKSPDHFLKHTLHVVSKGYGFPSIFNADAVVQEQLRQGKSLEDARAGGCSGCVEVGAFGKEAYILTGYFNMPKCLELALHDGVDAQTGKQLGPRTGSPDSFKNFDDVFAAYQAQFRHFLEIKLKGNHLIGRIYATAMPAPFLSVMTDDCVVRGLDYNSGGARYNNTYVQFVGLGTLADSFSALQQMSFDDAGTTRGPRVASGGPPDASPHQLFSSQGKPVSIIEAPGARYSKLNLPHFDKPWAVYHITFSTIKGRQLAPADRDIVLNCIRHWNERRYRLSAACVMPDHVHMIIQPGIESQDPDGNPIFYSLSTILHTIKSFTAHEINQRSGSNGNLWEKESFDRYMRSDADLEEKFHYVVRNPWTAGLVSPAAAYSWVWPSDGDDEVSAGRRNQHAGRVCSPLVPLREFVSVLDKNFAGQENLRQRLLHKTRKYGNDDDYADDLMVRIFDTCFDELDGRPDHKGGRYRIEMLPTTCHVYFGSVTGATPDGRSASLPLSEGISPVQGADRHGPTAVIRSASKMDHLKAGGTLLNMKFTPSLVFSEDGVDKWAHLVRGYFKMDGHHIQFNVVRAETLREAQNNPEQHRDLIVRVAGYSDYFCDLSTALQEEIITRTEHEAFQNAGV